MRKHRSIALDLFSPDELTRISDETEVVTLFGNSWQNFPGNNRRLEGLRKIILWSTGIKIFEAGKLKSLLAIEAINNATFETLESSDNLESLEVFNCPSLCSLTRLPLHLRNLTWVGTPIQGLPDNLADFTLETLYFSDCPGNKLVHLPATLRRHKITGCPDISVLDRRVLSN